MRARHIVMLLSLVSSTALFAQSRVRVPVQSEKASVSDTIGITEVEVVYHRPAVNKRVIWGGLVPYDQPWRTGANEPTLVTFSTPVKVEGKDLAAGTYSLYLIPTRAKWTAVFNRFTRGWGAYSYDQSEDALRVDVTPQPLAENQERMAFTFDDLSQNSASLSMRWEKVRVPIKIEADVKGLTLAAIKEDLRSGLHWDEPAHEQAARWAARNGEPELAMQWIDRALELDTRASALRTKAQLLEKKGDAKTAAALREKAASLGAGTEYETIGAGYQLINNKKVAEALKVFSDYAAAHPNSWQAAVAMGDAYAAQGDNTKAQAQYAKAYALAPTWSDKEEVQDSINAALATPPASAPSN